MSPGAPPYLAVGRIGRPHGIKGEVRLEVLTDFPDRFRPGARFHLGTEEAGELQPVEMVSVRSHHGRLLVRFDVAGDRQAATELVGRYVYIAASEARQLGPDEYYQHQLIGLEVVTDTGRVLGEVTSLIETGSADVLVVSGAEGEHLIPLLQQVVTEVDLASGRLRITPLPGLL